MNPTPILFLSDSPDTSTGLARISRDLAANLTRSPHFRVGFMGANGFGTTKLPFMQYNFSYDRWQWGEQIISRIWEDFAGGEKGIIFTVWDASRLFWFGCPQYIPEQEENKAIKDFLTSGNFAKWGYFAIDATGPGDKLTRLTAETLRGYDRRLAYTDWGAKVMSNTIGSDCEWIPHGIDDHLFQPRERKAARIAMGFKESDIVIGCLMSNQPRKDWGLFFAMASGLKDAGVRNLKLWCHVDKIERSNAWSIQALTADYRLGESVVVTTWMTDEELSFFYSGCDLTVLPSLGEGFGYPIVESLACGVPCIHGNYGGGAELIPDDSWLVEPYSFRLEGLHNCLRPVYRPEDWIEAVQKVREQKVEGEFCRASIDHLKWSNLWPVWLKWFERGINTPKPAESPFKDVSLAGTGIEEEHGPALGIQDKG